MGLDMYLNRMPRYKNTTPDQICLIQEYWEWQRNRKEHENCTFKEWCRCDEIDLPDKETLDFYAKFRNIHFANWDKNQIFGYYDILEEVGYWRKANQIHNWFVENVQNGIDDCDYHNEVTEDVLKKLLDVCKEVYESCAMITGRVHEGKVVIDPSIAEKLLPTQSGFFFGSTDYDEYYVQDIVDTIKIIQNVLETTDFDTHMIYYMSSW